jgi:amidohydrolase
VSGGDWQAEIAASAEHLVAFRRALHRHPEPSWEEQRTTAAIAEQLQAVGLDPRTGPGGTGLVCDLGAAEGPMVVLRGDIDALRLPDVKEVPYRSEVPGVCHACGHDVHATCVLGAGLALARSGAVAAGRVRLLFQPAEEAIPGGASAMVEAGLVDGAGAIFALHCDPNLEVGTVGLSAGPITSASDLVDIRVKGPGGHTARPHRTVDIVQVVGKLATDLPAGLTKLSDARDAVNLTFGSIEAGDAANVIPTEGRLSGSLRAGGRPSWEAAGPKLRTLIAAIAEPYGAAWELDHLIGAPPIVNDPWAVALVESAARATQPDLTLVPTVQSGGGEDFSWFLDRVRGAYARLGVRTPGAPVVDIHASAFDVDERAIPIGARLLAASALAALQALGPS